MKFAIALTVLVCMSATSAMACSYEKSTQNTSAGSNQQASNDKQASQGTTQPRTN